MEKFHLENLPSEETPIEADIFNDVFEGNTSMGSIVVEDIKSKNLFNFDNMRMDYTTFDYTNKTLTFAGFNNATTNNLKDFCPDLVAGETYTFSFTSTSSNKFIYLAGSSFTWNSGTSHTITQAELDSYVLFYASADIACTISNIQIEKGTTVSTYSEYIDFDSLKSLGRKLNNNDITTMTLMSGTSYAAWGGCYYYVKNNRVHIHIGLNELTANTTTTIFIMPDGFRPRNMVNVFGQNGVSALGISNLFVETNGEVKVNSSYTYATADLEYDLFE